MKKSLAGSHIKPARDFFTYCFPVMRSSFSYVPCAVTQAALAYIYIKAMYPEALKDSPEK